MSVATPDVRQARPAGDVVALTIDRREVSVPRGTTVLRAALQNGIYIPHLCDFRDLTPYAGCRMCLVEIERMRGVETSCTIVARDGMVVRTDSPALREYRLGVFEVLLSDHPDRCFSCPRLERCPPGGVCQRDELVTDRCITCPRNQQCELQRVADFIGWRGQRFQNQRRIEPPEHSNPFIEYYPDHCIYCTRCTRTCDEVIGASAIDLTRRGRNARISVHFDRQLTDSPCIFCGACAIACPTGSLIKADVTYGRIADITIPSTCAYCSVGCGLFLNLMDGRLVNASPDQGDPASSGYLCVRGQFGYDYATSRARLRTPLVRENGEELETTWDDALAEVARRLAEVRAQHGPAAIGVVGSGKISNEEAYLLQKLARAVLGTNNVDHPAGQAGHGPTLDALGDAFGLAAMTLPIAELEAPGCILLLGSDVVETHPTLWFRIQRAVRRGARLIVVDAKAGSAKRHASLVLRPRPGTEVALLNGIMRVVLDEELQDKGFVAGRTTGFDELAASLAGSGLAQVADLTGVPAADVQMAARLFATGGTDRRHPIPVAWRGLFMTPGQRPRTQASAIVFGDGLARRPGGAAAVRALANLALLTGMVGKPGAGLAPLPGQANAQGASDLGLLPGYLPGYRRVEDPAARAEVGAAWGATLPDYPGLGLAEMLEAVEAGQLRALYVVGANPLRSAAEGDRLAQALGKLDLLVVQDIFPTATSKLAHVILPAASAYEKDGTLTNAERRVQRLRAAVPAAGESRPDWQIVAELGRRLAARVGSSASFAYATPADVFAEIARVVPAYAGLSHARLDAAGGLQWPCPTADHPGTAYLFAEGFTRADGRGRFAPVAPASPTADPEHPLLLATARNWEQAPGSSSDHAKRLAAVKEAARVELGPADAAAAGVQSGDRVRVASRWGELTLVARVTGEVPAGRAIAYVHPDDVAADRLLGLRVDGRAGGAVAVRVVKA